MYPETRDTRMRLVPGGLLFIDTATRHILLQFFLYNNATKQCDADARGMCLVKAGVIFMESPSVIVHVNGMCAMGPLKITQI